MISSIICHAMEALTVSGILTATGLVATAVSCGSLGQSLPLRSVVTIPPGERIVVLDPDIESAQSYFTLPVPINCGTDHKYEIKGQAYVDLHDCEPVELRLSDKSDGCFIVEKSAALPVETPNQEGLQIPILPQIASAFGEVVSALQQLDPKLQVALALGGSVLTILGISKVVNTVRRP